MKVPTAATPSDAAVRSRACEGCRVAKIRCRASSQPGVCQKCLDSRKECVSKTGPRTRRPKKALAECPVSSSTSSKEAASSSTFSIDFALTAEPELEDTFDILRSMHEPHIDSLLPSIEDDVGFGHGLEFPDKLPSPAPTPASSTREYSITDLDGKPQFSLASAESLLEHFRSMLTYLPCVEIPRDTTVQSLASAKPFLLLAILTSASASKTLQGHNLYDAEFRKVLGLKFVAAGERTLELLQGLLVYCIWYPFHIRPQSKQMFRYIRMVVDLVHDLGLDDAAEDHVLPQGSDEHLERLRAYLGHCYLEAVFTSSWRPLMRTSASNAAWILRCCDTLQHHGRGAPDTIIVVLAKEGILYSQATSAIFARGQQTEDQRRLLLLGLHARSCEIRQQIPVDIACSGPVKLTTLFLELYLNSAGILQRHDDRRSLTKDDILKPDSLRLMNAVAPAKAFLDHVLGMDQEAFASLTAIDWCRIIIAIIIAIRLSLPIPECPDFDSSWARSEVQLHSFLDCISSRDEPLTTSPVKIDTLSAVRVVLGVIQRKFEQRVQAAERQEAAAIRGLANFGCPFLDGSLDEYLTQWDPDLSTAPVTESTMTQVEDDAPANTLGAGKERQPVFHDMWATMTMSWANADT